MSLQKVRIFGFPFIAEHSVSPVVADIVRWAAASFGNQVQFLVTPNAYTLVHYLEQQHRELYDHYKKSDYVLPDGMPVVWMSKRQLPARLTGSDLFPELWIALKAAGSHATLVLPQASVADRFYADYGRCCCLVPKFFDADDHAYVESFAADVAEAIIRYRSAYLFLGLNFPKQEKLGIAVARKLKEQKYQHGVLILLLGASFEFYFGLKNRAPEIFQRLGLEWLHRFLSEPKRLWKRYTVDVVRFFGIVISERRSPRP